MTMRLAAIVLLSSAVMTACTGIPHRNPASARHSAPAYHLMLRVLPDARRLQMTGTVRIAASDGPRTEIRLSLSERMRGLRVEILAPQSSAGLATLERAEGTGKNIEWIVRPSHHFPPQQPILLRFFYSGDGAVASMYYVGPEAAFASAWGSDWYPLIVGGSDKGTGDLHASVPAGWTVAADGTRRSTTQEEALGNFRFSSAQPTYFTFAAGKYSVVRHPGAVPVSAYMLTQRDHAQSYLQGIEAILTTLTNEFGPYPFDEIAVVEVPRELANEAGFNALAAAGLLLLNSRAFDAPDTKYLLEWLGHELSHQWFPHAVALRTPPGLYMEEALAEYGGLRVIETLAGSESAKRMRTIGFEYDPKYSAQAYFKLVGAGVDQPLTDLQPSLEHRNIAYTKGALVLDMLSREIGRAQFQRILRDINRSHRFQSISWGDFLRAIELGYGRELDWFFEQWFERAGAPDWQFSWSQEGDSLRGAITQAAPYYRASLKIEIRGNDGQRLVHVVETRGARAEFILPVGFRVQSVVLDPDYEVLRWTPEYRAAADAARSDQNRSR